MYINLKNSVLIIIVTLVVDFAATGVVAGISFTGTSNGDSFTEKGKDDSDIDGIEEHTRDLHVGDTTTSPNQSAIPLGSGGGYGHTTSKIIIPSGGGTFASSHPSTMSPGSEGGNVFFSRNDVPFGGGASGSGSLSNYNPQGAGFLLLILSLVSFVLAWFILVEAFRFQQELFKKSGWNVAADSGVALSVFFSIFIFAAWVFRWLVPNLADYSTGPEVLSCFTVYLLGNPMDFAPAFFVASIVPSVIGAYKFLFALSMLNQIDEVAENKKPNEKIKKHQGIGVKSPLNCKPFLALHIEFNRGTLYLLNWQKSPPQNKSAFFQYSIFSEL